MKFVQARHYTPTSGREIDLLVIHTMESPENATTAEDVAAWFAGPTAPQASAHYCIDADSVVQCVKDKDVAWHAPGANHDGIGLEHAGRASQTATQWHDAYSAGELTMSEHLAASLCLKYKIPAVALSPTGLVAGKRGITTHAAVSLAYKLSDHTDPGKGFPLVQYCATVAQLMGAPKQKPQLKEPEPVLRIGDVGWRVKQVQRLLRNGPRIPVETDGVFGVQTQRAVQQFQMRASLRNDGVVGPATWRALWAARYADK